MVVTDRDGAVKRALWGVVPLAEAPLQAARDGEDYAVLQLVLNAVLSPGARLHIDCAGTVDCAKDPRTAAGPQNPRAHWWAQVHDKLDDTAVHKIPSHCSENDVIDGLLTRCQWLGNQAADRYAREGAQLFRSLEEDRLVILGCH